jgi:hypothetical protein
MLHSKTMLQSRLFQDGSDFEVEVLGRCSAPYRGRLQWKDLAADVRKHQPAQKTKTVAALEAEFARRGLAIKLYTAVGTALDIHEGTDGFFEFAGVVVTIDLTLNTNKEVAKADMVVQKGDLENIPLLAEWVARKFIQKMEVSR